MPYLLRHAHAGNKHAWSGPDAARPLSAAGHREAQGLLVRLRDHPITSIRSSPTVRCMQTVEPLAQRRALRVDRVGQLDVHADPAELLELLHDPANSESLLCTHGELIGAILTHLAVNDLHDIGDVQWPKGSTWILEFEDGGLSRAHYLPPLRLTDSSAGYY
jgi:phosphohistidine phosphatase SixA